MKLRSLTLTNVRRFADPIEVRGFGDGLNLLAAPNEAGKSTIFEALNAVFFLRYGSWNKDARGLQPYAGGDPSVSVEIEAPAGVFTIHKTWSSAPGRKQARVTQNGRLVAQADAAEAWIADLIEAPGDGGPAGLLWVRQGEIVSEKPEDGAEARRGVLSSVAGEVEAMTGGRRMDAARARVEEELATYVTSRGPRRGGPLEQAETALNALQSREADLQGKAQALRSALDRRRELRHELKGLEDPQAHRDHLAMRQAAEAALEAANRYSERLGTARAKAENAAIRHQATGGNIDTLKAALDEHRDAAAQLRHAAQKVSDGKALMDAATSALAQAQDAETQATAARDAADEMQRRAEKAQGAASAQALRGDLTARLARGEAQERTLAETKTSAAKGPDAAGIKRLERLGADLQARQLAQKAAAPVIHFQYDGAGRAHLNGMPLDDGARTAVAERTELQLDGIGRLVIEPGQHADATGVGAAVRALNEALRTAGFERLDDARAAAFARREAETTYATLKRSFAAEFPDGLGALRMRLANLPEAVEPDPDLPSRAHAEEAARSARVAHDDAASARAVAAARAEDARRQADHAAAQHAAATDRLSRATGALAGYEDPGAALGQLQARLEQEAVDKAKTAEAAAILEREAPDLEAAQTRVSRLRKAEEQAATRTATLREDLAGLEGQIGSAADTGTDEELADTVQQRIAAEARRDAILFEVAVLNRLRAALEEARAQARDTYVAPVTAELRPLLAQFLPGAELALDADAVLPSELHRGGLEEPFAGLSGGMREQIALLVRLAFARILARAGRAAPVILDDAIVFTDDARIERLFDALTHQAQDLQIIVFSCRQNAFRSLPANILSVVPAASDGSAAGA
ncbi:AAA family ATPase [Rhodobacteraceae bacterium SC52]|nr:AAA family ATPase [Rhodobacteraceae bacterium SC52]